MLCSWEADRSRSSRSWARRKPSSPDPPHARPSAWLDYAGATAIMLLPTVLGLLLRSSGLR